MEKMKLEELKMNTRNEVISFLKKLWNEENCKCPICESNLELLHKKAKKDDCDWQCKKCNKTVKTIDLLNELNDKMQN